MTPDSSNLPAVSRRTLLRSGALAAGGAAVLPGVASAHECPRTPGYWANHPWPSTIPDPFEIGGVTMTVAEWQAFLVAPTGGDKAAIGAKHLVATVLNFQFRGALPEGDPGCVDEPLPDFGGRTVREIRLAAEQWLDASSFDDPGTRQDTWLAGGVDGEPLKNALDAFNNDDLGLDCDCDGEEDDGKGGNAEDGEDGDVTSNEEDGDGGGRAAEAGDADASAASPVDRGGASGVRGRPTGDPAATTEDSAATTGDSETADLGWKPQ